MSEEQPKRKRGRPPKQIITLDYFMIGDLAAAEWTHKAIAEKCGLTEDQFINRIKWDTQLQAALNKEGEPLDYEYINFLAASNCSEAEIARKIKWSKSQFSVRKKTDLALQDALDSGRNDFILKLRQEKRQAISTLYTSICKECGYPMLGLETYKDEDGEKHQRFPTHCRKCGSGKIEYKKEKPSTGALIWESKQHLGEKDRLEVAGDGKKPLVIETKVNEAEIDAKIERFIAAREAKAAGRSQEGATSELP